MRAARLQRREGDGRKTTDWILEKLAGSFSALTLNISGIVKDFVVIALSSVIFAAPVTGLSIFGYSVSVSAIFYRNRVKAKEKEAKEQAMFESKGGDEEYGALRKNAAPAGR